MRRGNSSWEFKVTERQPNNEPVTYLVVAVVFQDPLRIDFAAVAQGIPNCQAFIGPMPQQRLTKELLKGEELDRLMKAVSGYTEAFTDHLETS